MNSHFRSYSEAQVASSQQQQDPQQQQQQQPPLTSPSANSIIRIHSDSKQSLDRLFNPPVSSIRKRNLPPSFYDPTYGSKQQQQQQPLQQQQSHHNRSVSFNQNGARNGNLHMRTQSTIAPMTNFNASQQVNHGQNPNSTNLAQTQQHHMHQPHNHQTIVDHQVQDLPVQINGATPITPSSCQVHMPQQNHCVGSIQQAQVAQVGQPLQAQPINNLPQQQQQPSFSFHNRSVTFGHYNNNGTGSSNNNSSGTQINGHLYNGVRAQSSSTLADPINNGLSDDFSCLHHHTITDTGNNTVTLHASSNSWLSSSEPTNPNHQLSGGQHLNSVVGATVLPHQHNHHMRTTSHTNNSNLFMDGSGGSGSGASSCSNGNLHQLSTSSYATWTSSSDLELAPSPTMSHQHQPNNHLMYGSDELVPGTIQPQTQVYYAPTHDHNHHHSVISE